MTITATGPGPQVTYHGPTVINVSKPPMRRLARGVVKRAKGMTGTNKALWAMYPTRYIIGNN